MGTRDVSTDCAGPMPVNREIEIAMSLADRSSRRRCRRRGMTYILILGVAMMVTIIGLSALTVARVQRRTSARANESGAARFYARSAIELGFLSIRDDPAWRTSLGSGWWLLDQPIGDGTMSLDVNIVDDGDEKSNNDVAVLIGIGVCGEARHKMQVTVVPESGGMVIAPSSWKQVVD